MNFIDRKKNDYSKPISKYILNFSENEDSKIFKFLSKNQSLSNILYYLKNVRKRQKEDAFKRLEEKKIPENISINLNSLIYAMPLEYEDFDVISLIFHQLRAEDKKTYDNIQTIFRNKDNEGFRCNYPFGVIAGEKVRRSPHLSKIKLLKNIPSSVKNVELRYTKIMPSFAIIIFKFNLLEDVSKEINKLQNQEYLSTITFKIFPLNKLPYDYTESWGGVVT